VRKDFFGPSARRFHLPPWDENQNMQPRLTFNTTAQIKSIARRMQIHLLLLALRQDMVHK